MGLLQRVFETGEEKAFSQIRGIVEISRRANGLLKDVIDGNPSLDDLRRLEKETASEYFRVSRLLASGAIAPNLIDDMILMMNKEENITESIFKTSRQLMRYKIKDKAINAYLCKELLIYNKMANDSIILLSRMHTLDNITAMRTTRAKIKLLENTADGVRDALLDYAYNKNTTFKEFYHITNLAYTYDDVLDDCEDASDLFMSVMLSITT